MMREGRGEVLIFSCMYTSYSTQMLYSHYSRDNHRKTTHWSIQRHSDLRYGGARKPEDPALLEKVRLFNCRDGGVAMVASHSPPC